MAQEKRQPQPQQGGEKMQRTSEPQRGMQRGGMGMGGLGLPRTPFAFMRRMMDDMDRLFGEFGMGSMLPRGMSLLEDESMLGRGAMQMFTPEIEVMEKNGRLLVRADLPGLSKDDVRVNVEENALVLEGERRHEEEKTEGGVFHSERSYGSFRRVIPLPRGVNPDTCDARFDNGVLEIALELPQESRKRSIAIRAGGEREAEKAEKGEKAQPAQPRGGAQPTENGPGAPSTRH